MSYATLAQVKSDLGVSGTTDDAIIADKIAFATAFIDSHTHRTFATQINTTRYFDAYVDIEGASLILDFDLCSIASITNGDGTTVTSSQYVTEPRNVTPFRSITLKRSYGAYWTTDNNGDPENAIAISGKWGYSQTPPGAIEQACIRMASYMYRQKDSQVFDVTVTPELGQITIPQGTPPDVIRLLKPYIRYSP
jgi:hypothetical protein